MCKRGDIYYAELPAIEGSRIQKGYRPVMILSNQKALDNSTVYQYVPITGSPKRADLPIHVVLESGNLKKISMILGEQINSVDKHNLKKKIGTVSKEDMFKIELAAICQLGIDVFEIVRKLNEKKSEKYCVT